MGIAPILVTISDSITVSDAVQREVTGPGVLSVSPTLIDQSGGAVLEIAGSFSKGIAYAVHLGPLGTSADPVCYGGPGNGRYCYSLDGVMLIAVTPPVANGSFGAQKVSISGFGSALITVVEAPFRGTVLNSRRCHPPWAGAGARRVELEERRWLRGDLRLALDGITITDVVKRVVSSLRKVVDSIAVTDIAMRYKATNRSVADTIAVTDSTKRPTSSLRKVADTIAVTDSTKRPTSSLRNVSDSVAVTDNTIAVKT